MDTSIIDIIEDNNVRNSLKITNIKTEVSELKQEMRGIKEGMADIATIKEMLMSITKKEEEKKEERI